MASYSPDVVVAHLQDWTSAITNHTGMAHRFVDQTSEVHICEVIGTHLDPAVSIKFWDDGIQILYLPRGAVNEMYGNWEQAKARILSALRECGAM